METIANHSFSEDVDQEQLLQNTFKHIDTNHDQKLSSEELKAFFEKVNFASDVQEAFEAESVDDGIDFQRFKQIISKFPQVFAQRLQWVTSLQLVNTLAVMLPVGILYDELKGIDETSDEEFENIIKRFVSMVPDIMRIAKKKVKEDRDRRKNPISSAVTDSTGNDKFFVGEFATLEDFFQGPELLVGSPNPNVSEGIRREHCERFNKDHRFVTSNYKFETCSRWEYSFVADFKESESYPHMRSADVPAGRTYKSLEELLSLEEVKAASLKLDEVKGLRLYTGAMFMLYNAILRGYLIFKKLNQVEHFDKQDQKKYDKLKDLGLVREEDMSANKYETTIFVIISGIVKLSKHSRVPDSRRVYRGLGGMILPEEFRTGKDGFQGGVEYSFMSTTADKHVAFKYSFNEKAGVQSRGTVFEIEAGESFCAFRSSNTRSFPNTYNCIAITSFSPV